MTETKEYSAMLYALADDLVAAGRCTKESAERVGEAAERLDAQTVTIRGLQAENARLQAALDKLARLKGGAR